VTTHYDDEAQVENLKRWWLENWKALALGLGVGLGAVFGFEQWQDFRLGKSEHASQIYEDLKQSLTDGKADESRAIAERLFKEYGESPYAADAAFMIAAKAVDQNQLDEALTRLQWAAEHSKDPGIQRVARLRQARVLWAQNKLEEALKKLDGDAGDYVALYEELRGDIKLAQGDRAAARQAYEKAQAASAENAGMRDLLQRKLDDLADVVQS
jgi:predicted negative regulator of RcsB-dependent stress response